MPPRPLSNATPGERITGVDGLRGIAILLVLIHHFVELQLPREIGTWQAYLAAGLGLTFSGVDLFFVISGFLIGGILMDNRDAPNFFQVFYLRRTLRIVPLFYVFILVCWLLPGRVPGVEHATYPLACYLGFLCNFWMAAHNTWEAGWPALAWSLAVEEQFYLVFPMIVRFCRPSLLLRLTMAALVIGPVLRVSILLFAPHWSLGTHVLAPCRMDSLAFGVLSTVAIRHGGMRSWLIDHPLIPLFIAVALLPVLAGLTYFRASLQTMLMASVGYTVLSLFYAAVLLTVIGRRPSWLVGICETKIFVFIGGISYFIYLFHGLIGWFIFLVVGRKIIALTSFGDVGLILITLLVVLAAGSCSWILFESKLISLGRQFRYGSNPT